MPEDDGSFTDPYMETDPNGVYIAHNEDEIYNDPDWEYPEVVDLIDDGGSPLAAGSAKMTTINRSNGQATVRLNAPATFSGSIPFKGNVSSVLPAGTVLRGRDSNGNGVPDLLEQQLKKGRVHF